MDFILYHGSAYTVCWLFWISCFDFAHHSWFLQTLQAIRKIHLNTHSAENQHWILKQLIEDDLPDKASKIMPSSCVCVRVCLRTRRTIWFQIWNPKYIKCGKSAFYYAYYFAHNAYTFTYISCLFSPDLYVVIIWSLSLISQYYHFAYLHNFYKMTYQLI